MGMVFLKHTSPKPLRRMSQNRAQKHAVSWANQGLRLDYAGLSCEHVSCSGLTRDVGHTVSKCLLHEWTGDGSHCRAAWASSLRIYFSGKTNKIFARCTDTIILLAHFLHTTHTRQISTERTSVLCYSQGATRVGFQFFVMTEVLSQPAFFW